MTARHLTILTGASRGMGRAMAQQLIHDGHTLLGLSRQPDDAITAEAPERVTQWVVDLADPAPVAERLRQWLSNIDPQTVASATNSAGSISHADRRPGNRTASWIASAASVNPSHVLPPSPMKIFAGAAFHGRNPTSPAASTTSARRNGVDPPVNADTASPPSAM